MQIDDVLNLQYRKLLTEKEKIKEFIEQSNKCNNTTVLMSNVELLSLLLIDLENFDKDIPNNDDNELIKEYLLKNNDSFEKVQINIELANKFKTIGENSRINSELNKEISILYANYVNSNPLTISPINIEVLNKTL